MGTTIWWIRRDLRLNDNPALQAALDGGETVVPLFVLDDGLLNQYEKSEKRLAFLFASLHALDDDLRQLGSSLLVRRGEPLPVLTRLMADTGATAVFAQEDTHPAARKRDRAVGEALPLTLTGGTLLRRAGSVLKKDGDPYVVFTPFKRTWLDQTPFHRAELLPPPDRIESPAGLASDEIPAAPQQTGRPHFPPGEAEARRRLALFAAEKIDRYHEQRDQVAADGTSTLSPYFRFGLLSAREAAVVALQKKATANPKSGRDGADAWLNELIWRDFYNHIEFHFPHVHDGNFNQAYDGLAWRDDREEFAAWCQGRTGYPLVDAAMRQMNQTGWMHNRARMVVASFLIKDLLIDWRWGERYFMEQLVDGDPAANNGGWQWAAGTGTDAAPYFRIFNPVSQSRKYDGDGAYIRRWVPELAEVGDRRIHEPWKMKAEEERASGVKIGRDYPAPLVDHQAARKRTLAAFKEARAQAG